MKKTLSFLFAVAASSTSYALLPEALFVTTQGPRMVSEDVDPTVGTSVSPVITTEGVTELTNYNKAVIKAAKEDAGLFVASDGNLEKNALLQEAFRALKTQEQFQNLSDIELAQLIIAL